MKLEAPLLRWLALAALADWLIVRTLARSAIFMPKPPAVLAVYQALTWIGQAAAITAALLALITLARLAWRERTAQRGLISLALVNLLFLSLVFQVIPATGWLLVINQSVLLLLIFWMGFNGMRSAGRIEEKTAVLLPTLALLAGAVYQSVPTVFAALGLQGPAPLVNSVFNLGELLVALSGLGFWWAYGWKKTDPGAARLERIYPYLLAALPALAFTAMHWANPSMTGILAIWSSGLTLYLPWPLYTLSLYLASATVLITLRQGKPWGWGILLLAAGGYAPQLSTQIFLGLIALSLLGVSPDQDATQGKPHPGLEAAQSDPSSRFHPRRSEA